jgi:hypothetical protein
VASINLALFHAYLKGWEAGRIKKVRFPAIFLIFYYKDIAKNYWAFESRFIYAYGVVRVL